MTIPLAADLRALRIITGMNPGDVRLCSDMNDDGKIGPEEVVYILRKVGGFR
ncbi:hypothetical protein QUF80_08370 [Desulfococcaceae bacterium HSG8]|nr:hypothetical protein [Desulfococcaceae bacterium HSG8]